MRKKLAGLFLAGVMLLNLTACGEDPDATKYALIVNTQADQTYTDQAWEGIQRFSVENGVKCAQYRTEDTESEAAVAAIDQAVEEGAEVIFCMGEEMSVAVYEAQKEYKKVNFFLMDAEPHKENSEEPSIRENTCVVYIDEVQQGFLAGYSAVAEGARSIGFMGGVQDEHSEKMLAGFIQGAETAAREAGLTAGSIALRQMFTGKDRVSPVYMSDAIAWYKAGCEIIFAPDQEVAVSAAKAAENQNKKIICDGADQMGISAQVLTCTTKDYAGFVYYALGICMDDSFEGKTTLEVGAKENAIGLVMDNTSFTAFSQDKYTEVYANLANGTYAPADKAPETTILTLVNE